MERRWGFKISDNAVYLVCGDTENSDLNQWFYEKWLDIQGGLCVFKYKRRKTGGGK